MAVIIDHFKNDRIYNNELTELVPCNKNTLVANNKLKKEVKRKIKFSFSKRAPFIFSDKSPKNSNLLYFLFR